MRYLFIILLLSSCYTANKAKKQVSKAHALKPNVTSELCSNFYPVKDSIITETKIIQGKNDTIKEFFTDTLIDSVTKTKIIKQIKYKTVLRIDTITKTHIQYRETTSKLKDLNYKLRDCEIENSKNLATAVNNKNNRNFWRLLFFILLSLYITKVVLTKKL